MTKTKAEQIEQYFHQESTIHSREADVRKIQSILDTPSEPVGFVIDKVHASFKECYEDISVYEKIKKVYQEAGYNVVDLHTSPPVQDKEKIDVNANLLEFFKYVVRLYCWDCIEADGGDIQDIAVKLSLLYETEVTEEDIDENSDFEVGDTWYKFTENIQPSPNVNEVVEDIMERLNNTKELTDAWEIGCALDEAIELLTKLRRV